jgi:hypothetical protein
VLYPDGNSVVIGSEMNPEVNPALMSEAVVREGRGRGGTPYFIKSPVIFSGCASINFYGWTQI